MTFFGWTSSRQLKYFGTCKVLGPSVQGIVALLAKRFSLWILAANLIAWPTAYYAMNRWLQGFVYRTGLRLDMFVLAGVFSLVAAALPVVCQSLKAAVADSVKALRYE
jgi:putative ABC transport system permease protein